MGQPASRQHQCPEPAHWIGCDDGTAGAGTVQLIRRNRIALIVDAPAEVAAGVQLALGLGGLPRLGDVRIIRPGGVFRRCFRLRRRQVACSAGPPAATVRGSRSPGCSGRAGQARGRCRPRPAAPGSRSNSCVDGVVLLGLRGCASHEHGQRQRAGNAELLTCELEPSELASCRSPRRGILRFRRCRASSQSFQAVPPALTRNYRFGSGLFCGATASH